MTERLSPKYTCPTCGYDLAPPEGEGELTCPECGESTNRIEAGFSGYTARPWPTVGFGFVMLTLIPAAVTFATLVVMVEMGEFLSSSERGQYVFGATAIVYPVLAFVGMFWQVVWVKRRYRKIPPCRRSNWSATAITLFAITGALVLGVVELLVVLTVGLWNAF